MLQRLLFLLVVPLLLCSHETYRWNDLKIAYVEKGKGDQHVILLHGFAANIFTWHHQMDLLAKNGFHVWALDFVGFGQSDKPGETIYGLDLYESQIVGFMDRMKIQKAHIVGHSMGGAMALWLGMEVPERVSSLVLIDPASYPFEWPTLLHISKKYGRILSPLLNRKAIHYILAQIFFDRKKITSQQIDAYWEPIKRNGRDSLVTVLEAFDNDILLTMSKRYSSIKVPVLVVWGEEDRWIPVSTLKLFTRDMPHAEQAIIEKTGHAPHEERPTLFNQKLLRFLKPIK